MLTTSRKIKGKSMKNITYSNNIKNQKRNNIENLKISVKDNNHIDNIKQMNILNENNTKIPLKKKVIHISPKNTFNGLNNSNYNKNILNVNNNSNNNNIMRSSYNNNSPLIRKQKTLIKNGFNLINQSDSFFSKRSPKIVCLAGSNQINSKYNCKKVDFLKSKKLHENETEICINFNNKSNSIKNKNLNKNKSEHFNHYSELNSFSSFPKINKNYKSRGNIHERHTTYSGDKSLSEINKKRDSFRNNYYIYRNSKKDFAIFNSYYTKEEIRTKLVKLCNDNHFNLKKLNYFNYICKDKNNNSIKIELVPQEKNYLINIYDLKGADNINREIIKKIMIEVCF